ncbi:MAG: hypothetical protein C5B50_28775 [Verrucomicrobia bacterium]|nr:MAG: hypothetical protein C5B50_28775 [Verrucomicrobiota bacterium]
MDETLIREKVKAWRLPAAANRKNFVFHFVFHFVLLLFLALAKDKARDKVKDKVKDKVEFSHTEAPGLD